MYGFLFFFFLRAEEKAVLTVCTVDFSSKSFQFLVTKKFVLPTKSKNLGASWPQGFFSKLEPCDQISDRNLPVFKTGFV